MKLVMTLLVKDEVDIIEDQLIYHFNQGVDMAVVTDDGSQDGTREVLESFAQTPYLQLVEPADGTYMRDESAWRTRLGRLAATTYGADWIIHADADELWWPLVGDLRDSVNLVPPNYGAILAPTCNFLYTHDEPGPAVSRLRVRELRPVTCRVAHRSFPDVAVNRGHNRAVRAAGLDRLEKHDANSALRRTPFSPLRVFHYPVRSATQREQVASRWGTRAPGRDPIASSMDGPLESQANSTPDRQQVACAGVHRGDFVVDERIGKYYEQCWDPRVTSSRPTQPVVGHADELPRPDSELFEVEAQVADWLDRADTELRAARGRERQRADKVLATSRRGPLQSLHRLRRALTHGPPSRFPPSKSD